MNKTISPQLTETKCTPKNVSFTVINKTAARKNISSNTPKTSSKFVNKMQRRMESKKNVESVAAQTECNTQTTGIQTDTNFHSIKINSELL